MLLMGGAPRTNRAQKLTRGVRAFRGHDKGNTVKTGQQWMVTRTPKDVSARDIIEEGVNDRLPALLLVDDEGHGLDGLGVAGGGAGGDGDGPEVVEAEAGEEDVAKRPADGGEHAARLLRLDHVRVHEVLGVAPVLVVRVRGQQLQVHVLRVAVEELGAGLVDHLGVGVEAGVLDAHLEFALCRDGWSDGQYSYSGNNKMCVFRGAQGRLG